MIDCRGRGLPGFLVVGAMRAGTDSVGHTPAGQREICMARRELHLFERDQSFRQGPDRHARRLSPRPIERVVRHASLRG